MITTGSKLFYGMGMVSYALAVAYGWTTGGNGTGPVSLGYKGGVGDHFGYGVLMAAAAVSFLLGTVSVAVRDANASALQHVAGTEGAPPAVPAPPSYWPAISAFGVALVVVGLVASPILFVFGLVALGIVLVEWAVHTWADRATGDPATNRRIRNQLMNPIEFPAAGILAIGVIVVAFSRLFLALSAEVAVWAAMGVALLIVVAGFVIAARPRISRNVIVGVLLLAAVAVIGMGIAGAVAGEREFHPAVEEEGE